MKISKKLLKKIILQELKEMCGCPDCGCHDGCQCAGDNGEILVAYDPLGKVVMKSDVFYEDEAKRLDRLVPVLQAQGYVVEIIPYDPMVTIQEQEMLAPNLNTASLYAALTTDDIGPKLDTEKLASGLSEVMTWMKEREELSDDAQEILDIAEEMYPDQWDEIVSGLHKLVSN